MPETATINASAAPLMLKTLRDVSSWLCCGAITSPSDLAQAAPDMLASVDAAIAAAEAAEASNPTLPTVIRVASARMVNAPGTWTWFEHARNEKRSWKVDFIKAFTNDRASEEEIKAILDGRYVTHEEPGEDGPTLVLTIQKRRG